MKLIDADSQVLVRTGEVSVPVLMSFTMEDETGAQFVFEKNNPVVLTHVPTGTVIPGVIRARAASVNNVPGIDFFGVGRFRGVNIYSEAIGVRPFYFGQPGDETNGWEIYPR